MYIMRCFLNQRIKKLYSKFEYDYLTKTLYGAFIRYTFLAFFSLVFLSPLIIFLYLLIFLENKSPLFYQVRVGKNLKQFTLIKFRTMKIGTESCATHLLIGLK